MRKIDTLEDRFLLFAALVCLLAALIFHLSGNHAQTNLRVQYGVRHLPFSLVEVGVFFLLAGVARRRLSSVSLSTPLCLAGIAVVFGLFWVPAWFAGGFVADDWLLLAGASIRKVIYAHPGYSWYALDTVDGNFRPLGTILYFGFLLKWFGVAARVFTLGPFLLVLLSNFVIFAIVRELGYSRIAATVAALLFLSRGMIYTVATWTSALGDGISLLFCGLTALFVLKANQRAGWPVIAYHLAAWLCFVLAALGKQSAFVTPFIVVLLIFMRPGSKLEGSSATSLARRAIQAGAAFCVYAGSVAAIFLHAKFLLHESSPYPIRFSLKALFQCCSYATWYFVVAQFPEPHRLANLLPAAFGLLLVMGMIVVPARSPRILGDRPRDVIFACLAAITSLSLFVLLETRSAPYYGCMAAFWFSIALGIVLTRYGRPATGKLPARVCAMIFCVLILTGFIEVRIEQTGLIPTGGYLWGTFGMDTERAIYVKLQRDLGLHPGTEVAVFQDCPTSEPYTAMAISISPSIPRVLLYDTNSHAYMANDREGLQPIDGFAGLGDLRAYRWTEPLSDSRAAEILRSGNVLLLDCKM